MHPFIRAGLKTVFHSGRQIPQWRRQKHRGDKEESHGVLCFSGLTANGAFNLKPLSHGLYERFSRKRDIWHRNLYGHTGAYRDFRKSRMWHWIADAAGSIAKLLERHQEKQVVLLGISTGALVLIVAVYLFEQLQNGALQLSAFPAYAFSRFGLFGRNVTRLQHASQGRRAISQLVLIVPAFRLRRTRDEMLLITCFFMYYFGIPLATLFEIWLSPSSWLLILVVNYLNLEVFSRIWIPSGDAIAAHELGARSIPGIKLLLVVASCFYCGLFPWICLLQGFIGGRLAFLFSEIVFLLTLLPPLLWEPMKRANGSSNEFESAESPGYLWLPVVATSTLMPLQWLACYLVPKLKTPVIAVLAEKDLVVDNLETRTLIPDANCIECPELSHGDWTGKHQSAVLQLLASLLPESIPKAS